MSSRFIFFDLEGPLALGDNAYELMKLFPRGGQLFEIISRYDDLLTLEQKDGYEPGDTLALILPFLICHGILEEDIKTLARGASLTNGACDLIVDLHSQGWDVFCISTSYEHYAHTVTQRVGISRDKVACTPLPIDHWGKLLSRETLAIVEQVEKDILSLPREDEVRLKQYLDEFYWGGGLPSELGEFVCATKPVGGSRKVAALEKFTGEHHKSLDEVVVVGDSITDFKMLRTVNQAGGVAVAFNANEYALPYATVSLASTHLNDLRAILDAWESGGLDNVRRIVEEKEKEGGQGDREHLHWIDGKRDLSPVLEVHRRIRQLVREDAAKLG